MNNDEANRALLDAPEHVPDNFYIVILNLQHPKEHYAPLVAHLQKKEVMHCRLIGKSLTAIAVRSDKSAREIMDDFRQYLTHEDEIGVFPTTANYAANYAAAGAIRIWLDVMFAPRPGESAQGV